MGSLSGQLTQEAAYDSRADSADLEAPGIAEGRDGPHRRLFGIWSGGSSRDHGSICSPTYSSSVCPILGVAREDNRGPRRVSACRTTAGAASHPGISKALPPWSRALNQTMHVLNCRPAIGVRLLKNLPPRRAVGLCVSRKEVGVDPGVDDFLDFVEKGFNFLYKSPGVSRRVCRGPARRMKCREAQACDICQADGLGLRKGLFRFRMSGAGRGADGAENDECSLHGVVSQIIRLTSVLDTIMESLLMHCIFMPLGGP